MLEVGCGVAEITPNVGTPLSGFIFRENRPSTCVDDPLFVRALALMEGNDVSFLLNYDLLGIGASLEERILTALEDGLGDVFVRQRCAIVATHTHSAPPVLPLEGEAAADVSYLQLLCTSSIEAARSALERLQPVTLHTASVRVPNLVYNRRAVLADSRVSMALEPDAVVVERGPVDDELVAIVWQDQAGRNVAVALHFACHGVAVCTQAIGGDIPGALSRRVGTLFDAPCLYLQGAAGDINPTTVSAGRTEMQEWVDRFMGHLFDLPKRLHPALSHPLRIASTELPLDYAPLPTRGELERIVNQFDRIARGDVHAPEIQDAIRSLGNVMNFKPGEQPDPEKAAYAATAIARAGRRTLAVIEAGHPPSPCPLRLAAWRLGDVVLAFAAAELFAVTGFRIRKLHKRLTVLPVTYLTPLVGYVPDRAAMARGGYEVDDAWRFYGRPAPFHPDSEEGIVGTLASLIAQIGVDVYQEDTPSL